MTNSITFTFIIDVSGGTYISQFSGSSKEEATISWAHHLDKEVVLAFNSANSDEIITEVDSRIKEDGLTGIQNVSNVWFLYVSIRDISGYLNIIQTQI